MKIEEKIRVLADGKILEKGVVLRKTAVYQFSVY